MGTYARIPANTGCTRLNKNACGARPVCAGRRRPTMTTPTVERKSRASAETVLKTLTALFGLIAVVLGIWTSQLNREKQQAETQTVVVQQESSELKQQVAAMSQEIERLKAQLATAPSSSAEGTPPAGGQRYSVALRLGETFDLDTRKRSRVESTGTELSRAGYENMLMSPRGYELFPISADLNEANCRTVVESGDNRRDSFAWDEMTPGLTFCLATSESRMAGVTITKKAVTYEGSLELGVQVW
jgi:uncharacterized small protein (DUF1192 family)